MPSASPADFDPFPSAPLLAPPWVDALCPAPERPPAKPPARGGPRFHAGTGSRFDLRLSQSADGQWGRAFARIKGALHLPAAVVEEEVEALYAEMFAALDSFSPDAPAHPVRLWNGLPHIIESMEIPVSEGASWERETPAHEKFDRYMAFNAGRCRAMLAHYGGKAALARAVPAASGVGHGGEDLVVHGLCARAHGVPVENPRQTPAWRYSQRFGPLPPCFARATSIVHAGQPMLLVSGTASVVGEETLHPGQLAAQAEETFVNLRALVEAAGFSLAQLRDARVYVSHARDLAAARTLCENGLPGLAQLEVVHAEICRPGLILEIEGICTP